MAYLKALCLSIVILLVTMLSLTEYKVIEIFKIKTSKILHAHHIYIKFLQKIKHTFGSEFSVSFFHSRKLTGAEYVVLQQFIEMKYSPGIFV